MKHPNQTFYNNVQLLVTPIFYGLKKNRLVCSMPSELEKITLATHLTHHFFKKKMQNYLMDEAPYPC